MFQGHVKSTNEMAAVTVDNYHYLDHEISCSLMSTVMIWITRVWLILHFNFDSGLQGRGGGWVEGGVQWTEIKVPYVENQELTKVTSFT